MSNSTYSQPLDGPEKYWQLCELPDCTTEVPKSKGICDECAGVGGQ